MFVSGTPYTFESRKAELAAQGLLPFLPGLGLVRRRIPMEHRIQAEIQKLACGFLFRPSRKTLPINRAQDPIGVTPTVGIAADDASRVLANLKPQVEAHRSFRHASQHRH